MQWTQRATLGAWICGLASVALAWGQARWYIFHPHYLPLCTLYVALAASTVFAVACCLWRIARGPHRVWATILVAAAILPAGFWANVGRIAERNFELRWIPNTLTMRLAKVMGVAFMRAEVDLAYRHRLETTRLVMFFDSLDRPDEDLAAMDQYLMELEELLGGTIQAQVYWVRGSLPRIGIEALSVHGLALGSDHSPEIVGHYRLDRHELAHAALDWFRVPSSDPPYILNEGWAMAQCGDTTLELAQAAAHARRENPSVGIRELFGPDWYYRDAGPVYSIGGAFVDFLIRTRGAVSFRRFYTECQLDDVEAKCQEIFEIALDDLEAEFWTDLQTTLLEHGSRPTCRLSQLQNSTASYQLTFGAGRKGPPPLRPRRTAADRPSRYPVHPVHLVYCIRPGNQPGHGCSPFPRAW